MRRHRILVVDDDRGIRQLYRAALMLAGFQVETAEDGLGALRRIDEGRPDLVVLDLHMPRIDGLAVLSELRANSDTVNVPVVVVTGTEYQFAPGDGGASTLLKKPCEPEELISVIEHHLRSAA
ncbi:MAG: response regulator transcription factor [Vicinamibacterales bacterium]